MEHKHTATEGKYQLETYKAQLRLDSKPEETRQQTFRIEQGSAFSADEAYNLLCGRAIQKEHATIEGQRQNTWMQLDFNDKDAAGNFRIKEFHAGNGYDLRQMLSQLPLKETSMDEKEKLMNDLINGSRQQVTFIKEGKDQIFYIEANPQHRTINMYDEHSKKISMASALGNKTADAVQMIKKTKPTSESWNFPEKRIVGKLISTQLMNIYSNGEFAAFV